MRKSFALLCVMSVLVFTSEGARANSVWNWSFAGESGQFVTDGSGSGPGTYNLIDFSVTSSSAGGAIGSLSGGQYTDGLHNTYLPFSFVYDGAAVTMWESAGGNSFDWWVFEGVASAVSYFFGWDTGNINDPTKAAWWISNTPGDNGAATVSVVGAAVPEPVTMLLFSIGVVGLAGSKLRAFRASAAK